MKRPLIYALAVLIAGILTEYCSMPSLAVLTPATVIGMYMIYRWRPVVVLLAFYALGILTAGLRTGIDPGLAQSVGQAAAYSGVITDETKSGSGYSLTVRLDSGVKVIVRTLNEGAVGTGGRVEFTAALEHLSRRRNPGGFDEFMYMRARGIQFKAFCRSLVPTGSGLRTDIAAVYDDVLPVREAGIVKAMILGDKAGLDDKVAELYRVAGVYHILAISGLHISVLALAVNILLAGFIGRRPGGLVTLIFLFGYCAFTGFSVSVVRAALMYAVIISADILLRESDTLSSAAFAAIALLLWQPLYLWDVGFLYSFSAVAGMAALAGPIKSRLPGAMPGVLRDTFSAALAATLCTMPVSAYYFYYIMPYGLLANLLIVPTAGLVVIMGFAVGVLGLFIRPAAAFLAHGLFIMLKLYEGVCGVFAALPGAAILTGSWPLPVVIGWYLLIAAAVLWGARGICLGVAAYAALVFITVLPDETRLYRLDVDDGACAVLTHAGECYVFDSGGEDSAYALSGYLEYRGIGVVDAYFGLHDDLNLADNTISGLKPRAVFARPELAGLDYGGRVEALAPGRVLRKGAVEFRITDGYGVIISAGNEGFELR